MQFLNYVKNAKMSPLQPCYRTATRPTKKQDPTRKSTFSKDPFNI